MARSLAKRMMSDTRSSSAVDAELNALLRRIGIDADPAELPMLADNMALLLHHWAILRDERETTA